MPAEKRQKAPEKNGAGMARAMLLFYSFGNRFSKVKSQE
jgi:hypothetical protein